MEVIDYDANNKCYYQPVNLDDPRVLLGNGLDPSESDPQFHQQMVYAVASEILDASNTLLGVRLKWSFGGRRRADRTQEEEDNLIIESDFRIFPHAMQDANAFYSEICAHSYSVTLLPNQIKSNLPGQIVFTCLSHDIVAHETTHALVDSQTGFFTGTN